LPLRSPPDRDPAGDRRPAVLRGLAPPRIRLAALRGVNAAVVGLLIAAFYDPVWYVGIANARDFALAAAAFLLLHVEDATLARCCPLRGRRLVHYDRLNFARDKRDP
jgi:hypothetical protein